MTAPMPGPDTPPQSGDSAPHYVWAPPPPGYPYQPYAGPIAPARRSRRGAVQLGIVGVAAVSIAALAFVAGTARIGLHKAQTPSGSAGSGASGNPFSGFGFGGLDGPDALPDNGSDGGSDSGSGSGSGSVNDTTSLSSATHAQQVGVVDIDAVWATRGTAGAGTGLVLDTHGDVLTNNHVVGGATSIRVTVVATGQTYRARVVGTDARQDIAVIRLIGGSGLDPANFGDSNRVQVGDTVVGVGNAGGVGGTPSAATGTVLALHQQITASDEGSSAERLSDVIVSDAPIEAGDSGGPLFDSSNRVVGIDTAASVSGSAQGFSIPIDTARSIAGQILAAA